MRTDSPIFAKINLMHMSSYSKGRPSSLYNIEFIDSILFNYLMFNTKLLCVNVIN